MKKSKTLNQLQKENEDLRIKCLEAEEVLRAIREGAVDAIVVSGREGEQVFTLSGEELVYRRLVESMGEGGLTTSPEGKILFCNQQFSNILGLPMEKILGCRLEEFIKKPDRIKMPAFLAKAKTKPAKKRLVFLSANGTSIPARVSANALNFGDSISICFIVMDQTELEASKEAVQQIAEQREALALVNKELVEFSCSVYHYLRNPLNAITVNAEVLSMEAEAKPETNFQIALTHITQSVERMARAIIDLSTFSGISRRNIHLSNINLSAMVQGCLAGLKASHPQREAVTKIQAGLTVHADPDLIRLLVENLIHNAWKFTSKKKIARIELGAFDKDGKRCYFIRDNGVGFDMQESDWLFTPDKLLRPAQKYKGSGIGLMIAKKIVEKHNGAIWAEGEKGKGATFFFHFA
ncbi:MAG TPA: hypothetical protein DEP85_06980 [Holosporales bacterium]|nr:hypothetical protein [Holosporales bacterium]